MQNKERSIEPEVEFIALNQLKDLGVEFCFKNESPDEEIREALKFYPSKGGGEGGNFPDIQLFLTDEYGRKIPVMIEIKGGKGKLAKFKNANIENSTKDGKKHFNNIKTYALNGAVHYASAILDYTFSYDEAIAVGINGYYKDERDKSPYLEYAFYYLDRENLSIPKKIGNFRDLSIFKDIKSLIQILDFIKLDEKEQKRYIEELESDVERELNNLNQFLHDKLYNFEPNTRVALLVGMTLASQGIKDKYFPLHPKNLLSEQAKNSNDGQIFIARIEDFLEEKRLSKEKINEAMKGLKEAFIDSGIWSSDKYKIDEKDKSGSSPLKIAYKEFFKNIYPLVLKLKTADIAGRFFNSLTKWLKVPDGNENDVVLTPRYVVDLMVALAGVNKDSFVWDYATGSGAFLISAMNAMIKDCEDLPLKEKEAKIAHIKTYQLLGLEVRPDIYLLGVLNMILLDDGSANLIHKDSLKFDGIYEQGDKKGQDFPADVFLLNPPYSAEGKGFIFVERALKKMNKGKACVIIQENAGSGNGTSYTKDILKHSTLLASIKMPSDLFAGKSNVQTAIYVFEVGKAHNTKQMVKFIDFSNDGYARASRKKAKASTNLKDIDNAKARYEELINVVLYGSGYLHYYKDFYIEDCIDLKGKDWTYAQHKKIDTTPTLADFKKCVSEYLAWEVSNVLKNSTRAGTEGNASSPRLAKLEEQFKQNGGVWREFKLGELFEHIKPHKHAYNKGNLPKEPTAECDLPALTCTSANQGIACYMPRGGAEILKNVISVAANGDAPAFYQPHEFAILQDAYALRFKGILQESVELSHPCYLYLTALLQKILQKYNWNNKSGWTKVSQEFISLPTLNDEIAFSYMESYIKELEAERLEELEAYLRVTGLKDYTLTQEEKEALKAFENLSTQQERERESKRRTAAA